MNLDELMVVWRTQDAAPLHDVNRTLLHLALRQDEAKLQKQRRRERWIVYVFGAGVVAGMAVFFSMMIYFNRHRPERVVTGWDLGLPFVGAAGALLAGSAMYANHKGQTRREQSFGESLRDQLNRSIAQLDNQATSARWSSLLAAVMMGGVCPTAILLLGSRVNGKSISDDGYMIVSLIVVGFWCVGTGIWEVYRDTRDVVLPRKRRLEALLSELDGQ
jgi:hypothetical protein